MNEAEFAFANSVFIPSPGGRVDLNLVKQAKFKDGRGMAKC